MIVPGALAEFVRLPTNPLRRLPDDVSDAEGAALQPLASAVLCTVDAGIEPGDDVLVVGIGVMGFQCALLAKRFGASKVYTVDVRQRPLSIAADHGLTPIDATSTDPVAEIRVATDGLGTDIAFEAVGGEQSMLQTVTIPSRKRSARFVAGERSFTSATSMGISR